MGCIMESLGKKLGAGLRALDFRLEMMESQKGLNGVTGLVLLVAPKGVGGGRDGRRGAEASWPRRTPAGRGTGMPGLGSSRRAPES